MSIYNEREKSLIRPFFRAQTEIWDIETLENRIILPTLPSGNYGQFGLFLVDKGYCKQT